MSSDHITSPKKDYETFDSIMQRRLMIFTMSSIGREVKLKLKNVNQLYGGQLYALDPTSFSLVIRNFSGVDERADFKVLTLRQTEYCSVSREEREEE